MQALQCEPPKTGPQGWADVYADHAGNPLPHAWAIKLIQRLVMTYGTRFWQAYEGITEAELAQHWAEELASFEGAEIAAGLSACKTRPWPPTLPEFMALCRPWMEPEIAFQQAVKGLMARKQGKRGYWAHPAVYWTAVRIGEHDMLAGNWQTLKTRWEAAFRHLLAQADLLPVPEPAQALPAPGQTRTDRQTAQAQCQKIQRMAAQALNTQQADKLQWARNILANPKGRTLTVIQMARRALGVDDEGAQPLEMAA